MEAKTFKSTLSQVWLSLVPLLTIVLALGVGYISYKIYLPIWLLNVALMSVSIWTLGYANNSNRTGANKHLIMCGVFFIIPTMLTSMFFGLGAPPYESPERWIETMTEQRVRYYFLLSAGLFIAFGFATLGYQLKKAGEAFYSTLGITAMMLAAAVFFIDMSFWGFYLPKLYQRMVETHALKTPEYVFPLRTMFYYVNIFASALTYISTALFALSLKKTGWFKPSACNCYIYLSGLFLIFDLLPPTLPEPFATLNFIISIPAVPFMFPYFMGINLLRCTDN